MYLQRTFVHVQINHINQMTDLSSIGVTTSIVLLIAYAFYILIEKIINSQGSLRDSESVHRALMIIGGLLIGLGLGGQETSPGDSDFASTNTYLGILLLIAGLVSIVIGGNYLRSALWRPLEEISEYSAEFGSNFIATRLPISGGLELQRFSERFNDNVIELANKVATFQIQMEAIEDGVKQTVNAGIDVSNQSQLVSNFVTNYTQLSHGQQANLSTIESKLTNFVTWYNDTQVALAEQFIELRSIAELGNLLAVNAAIESSNIEVPNPGFETIATKLHELARSLEERQDGLRYLVEDINIRYRELSQEITTKITDSLDVAESVAQLASQVNENLDQLLRNEEDLSIKSSKLIDTLAQVSQRIPRAY
jgi:methyl-accepting chemotaxis protein